MSEQQLLRDPDIELTQEVIAEALGSANKAYLKFIDKLPAHEVCVDWRYYKDGNAWLGKGLYKWMTSRGTNKEMTVFWLSIWDGYFKVCFYIPEKARADALNLILGAKAMSMVESAKQMGKLKFFPVVFELNSNELFDDIFTLVDFKKSVK